MFILSEPGGELHSSTIQQLWRNAGRMPEAQIHAVFSAFELPAFFPWAIASNYEVESSAAGMGTLSNP
jgi:hypothetical protein